MGEQQLSAHESGASQPSSVEAFTANMDHHLENLKKSEASSRSDDSLEASQSTAEKRDAAPAPQPEEVPAMATKTPKSPSAKSSNNGNADTQAGNGETDSAGAETQGTIFSHPTPGGTRTVSSVLGEITWLMSQSAGHKNFFISDLEWMVMTPVLLEQFRIFYAQDRPMGVALWAYVNDDVEKRLEEGGVRMSPNDWKCGEKLWIVDIIAPFGGQEEMLADLKEKVFGDREMRIRRREK